MPRPRRRRPAPIRDPLLPVSERVLQRQAGQAAHAQFDPLIAELTRSINQRAAAGARNIAGVTKELASSLGGYEQRAAGIYGQSRQALEGVNRETADRINQAGVVSSQELAKRLELSGGDQSLAQALSKVGTGAAAASQAVGGNALGQMIQNEASARDYAAKLPGLASLSGAQGIGTLQAQKQRDLSEGLGEIRSQMPSVIAGLIREGRQRNLNASIALHGFGLDKFKLAAQERAAQHQAAAQAQQHQADLVFKSKEAQRDREAQLKASRVDFQQEMQKIRAEYQNSEKTREDQQRFEDQQRQATQRFKARQDKLNRRAYGQGKKGGKKGTRRTDRDSSPSSSPSGLGNP